MTAARYITTARTLGFPSLLAFDAWLTAAIHRLKDDLRMESANLVRSFR